MALSKIDVFQPQKFGINVVLDMVEQTGDIYPENTDEAANPRTWEDSVWKGKINMVNTVQITKNTDNDETMGYDRHTGNRITETNTRITGRTYEFSLTRTCVLFDAINRGIPNPTSDDALAAMSADSENGVPIYATDNPYVPMVLRIQRYSSTTRQLLSTEYLYCNVMATGEENYDGKILQPTITAEVQASTWNRAYNEKAFTKQTETPGE